LLTVALPVVMPVWGTMLKPIAESVLKPVLMPMFGTISVSITNSIVNPIVSFVRWFSLNAQQARNSCFDTNSSERLMRIGLQRHSWLVQLIEDAMPQMN
jgi:hypothetical protein